LDPKFRAKTFARISQQLLAEQEEHLTLERMVQLAVETIDSCDFAGVSLRRARGRVESPAQTDPLARAADELQQQLGEGPCLDAIDSARTNLVRDTATDQRWPHWGPCVAELGIRSVIAVQMATDTVNLGAINCYAYRPDAFTEDDVVAAEVFAEHAAMALESAQVVTGLRQALTTRHRIGVAQGILMQRYGLTLERSLEVLMRYSQETNIKLRDVAERMIETGAIPVEDEQPARVPATGTSGAPVSP
jgi:GAF domain-containing protein